MNKEEDNKAIVGRWFRGFWGKTCNLAIVDELATTEMLLKYSLHEPRRGRKDIKAFRNDFRSAFPDLNFCRRSVGRWLHSYRPDIQQFSGRVSACGERQKDALHRHDGTEGSRRQDRRGNLASMTALPR